MQPLRYTPTRVAALALTLVGGAALADTLSDFQYAARQIGCASIPYSDLRSACVNSQRDVDDYCKSRGKIGCDDLGSVPGLNKSIEGIESKIRSLQSTRKSKEREISSADAARKKALEADLEEIDEQIADLQAKIVTMQDQSGVASAEINRRIEVIKGCVQARVDVQDIFDKASTKAAAETDAGVVPLATQLRDAWAESGRTHAEAVSSYQAAQAKCQQRL